MSSYPKISTHLRRQLDRSISFFRVHEFERGGRGERDRRPRRPTAVGRFSFYFFSRRRGAAIPNSPTKVPCQDRWHSSRTISVAFTKPKKDSEL